MRLCSDHSFFPGEPLPLRLDRTLSSNRSLPVALALDTYLAIAIAIFLALVRVLAKRINSFCNRRYK
jgi:hypothetical protein